MTISPQERGIYESLRLTDRLELRFRLISEYLTSRTDEARENLRAQLTALDRAIPDRDKPAYDRVLHANSALMERYIDFILRLSDLSLEFFKLEYAFRADRVGTPPPEDKSLYATHLRRLCGEALEWRERLGAETETRLLAVCDPEDRAILESLDLLRDGPLDRGDRWSWGFLLSAYLTAIIPLFLTDAKNESLRQIYA